MKFEDLLKKYDEVKNKAKETSSLKISDEEKKFIDKIIADLKPGEIAKVSAITNVIAENRYGKDYSTAERAKISMIVRAYLEKHPEVKYVKASGRFKPAIIQKVRPKG